MSFSSLITKGACIALLAGVAIAATAGQDCDRGSSGRGGFSIGYQSRDFNIRLNLGSGRSNRYDNYDRNDCYNRNDRYDRYDRGYSNRPSRYYSYSERRPVQSGLTRGRGLGSSRSSKRCF